MPNIAGQFDKTCPKCAATAEAVKATTGQAGIVVVDLRCPCGHTWAVTLTSRINS